MMTMDYSSVGTVYREQIGDGSPLNRKENTKTEIVSFPCDVQMNGSQYTNSQGVSIFLYDVYFGYVDNDIYAGDIFETDNLKGVVHSIWKHLKGCEMKVRDESTR